MKKIICFVIAFLVLLSIHIPANTVFAAQLSDSLIMRLTETHSESQIDINVRLVTNTGVSGMTLELAYNKNIFEFKGYEKGTALESMDLMTTDLSTNPNLPVKFNWFNQNAENDYSTGNILQLHFALKPSVPSGEYEIGFKFNDGDITYIGNGNTNSKSAIISKTVVNVDQSKISETEIVEEFTNNNTNNIFLILGIVAIVISVGVATTLLVLKSKRKKEKKNWLKI